MPFYFFENPETGEVIEVMQSMNDEHIYVDENGLNWKRVFSSPTYSIKGTALDFRSEKDKEKWTKIYKKRYNYNKNKNK